MRAVAIDEREGGALGSAPQAQRWLFIDAASEFGGHEVMLLRWLEELASQRAAACFLLARSGSQLAREASRHASVLELPRSGAGVWRTIVGALRDAVALARAILLVRSHVCIVAEGCLLAQPLFVLLARLLRQRVVVYVPLVQTSTSMRFRRGPLRDACVRAMYAHVPHAWITLTSEQARDFRDWARVRRPILTLPNTVSSTIERRGVQALRSVVPRVRASRLRVLVLGRIEAQQKGLDLLIDHLAAHPSLGAHMCVSFVGSGPYEAQLRARLLADPVLAGWVSLQPWSPPVEALETHDVLLMASRYEGVPLVMLEAMAMGVPVIAPNLDGTRAFLPDSALFPPQDMGAAFEILEGMFDPVARRAAAERNRATFERKASNAAFAAAVETLTQELRQLGERSLGRRSA